MEAGSYEAAIVAFEALNGYNDSADLIEECRKSIAARDYEIAYKAAEKLMEAGLYEEALGAFEAILDNREFG